MDIIINVNLKVIYQFFVTFKKFPVLHDKIAIELSGGFFYAIIKNENKRPKL